MKDFEPSGVFVERVMRQVHAYEKSKMVAVPLGQRLLTSGFFRFAFSSGAALLGILNLIRLYFALLSPAGCG